MAKLKTFHELFIHELRDIASAEEQILKALPKMVKAASSEPLREALESHRIETESQLEGVLELLESFDEGRGRVKCAGMAGIISEGEDQMKETDEGDVRDAAIIASAQKVEHYEIASYGTARAWAELMGHRAAVATLDEILSQEKEADQTLTSLSESINVQAQDGNEEEMDRKSPPATKSKSRSKARAR